MRPDSIDRAALDALVKKLGFTPQEARFDSHGYLSRLSLYGVGLSQLPDELFQFIHLRHLNVSCNLLSSLPVEIGHLMGLKELFLNHNCLTFLPPEIGQLTKLEFLTLNHNRLTSLPQEIGELIELRHLELGNNGVSHMPEQIRDQPGWQKYTSNENRIRQLPREVWNLKNLESLGLWATQLTTLPPELGQLTNLTTLQLGRNQFSSLPSTIGRLTKLGLLLLHGHPIKQVPSELGDLKNLKVLTLELSIDQTPILPTEIWQLTNLRHFDLYLGQMHQLSARIGQLTRLEELYIGGNRLNSLPSELWQLSQLRSLDIYGSPLDQLPAQVGLLTNLRQLRLHRNRLSHLPPEIGRISQLEVLDLRWNDLRQLPPEIGNLNNLRELRVDGNPRLLTPPPEIVQQGTRDILAFLAELQQSSTTRFEAKLLVVGEGGTGKSSLLRALQKKRFEPQLETTHGIEINQIELFLPDSKKVLTLNSWDFGGQHIYHATHQFFLTRRSIYLVVWNARLGVEQGRLHYWLEAIKALAPGAPVILVATHIDERTPDINYQFLKKTYPQIVGNLSISNKTEEGVGKLKQSIVKQALSLPHVGQPWPAKWLAVEQALQRQPEHHIDAKTYFHHCEICQVDESIARGTLGDYLHDLGKILFFRDDYILCNMVVLKPNWITKAISLVLTDEKVRRNNGILRHADLPYIWAADEQGHPYEPHLYPIFLRLMERFDLSYQIEGDIPGAPSTSSLIPQLLPYQPPANLPAWPQSPKKGETQVAMIYRFDFVPTGIMSWLIVRTHRYTQNLHWREGALLVYEGHRARIELNEMQRELRLVVRGVQPHNFFTILMNTIDIILARFKGLAVQRNIPCVCHWEKDRTKPCPHYYSYEELIRRMKVMRYKVECAQTFTPVQTTRSLTIYGAGSSRLQSAWTICKN